MKRYIIVFTLAVAAAAGVYAFVPGAAKADACDSGSIARVSFGARGAHVENVQACLIAAGFSIPAGVTGYYGAQTVAAVRALYAAALSMPDWHGRSVGPLGTSALASRASGGTAVPVAQAAPDCNVGASMQASFGASGAAVRNLQACLIRAGFAIPSGVTGHYGPQTVAAVRAFYAASLDLTEWHGRSVGPRGQSGLAARASGVAVPVLGASAWKRVDSEATFKKYVESYADRGKFEGAVAVGRGVTLDAQGTPPQAAPMPSNEASGAVSPQRFSETNVQVAGIDEPDIVKTDGRSLYISQLGGYWARPLPATTNPVATMPPLPEGGLAAERSIAPYYNGTTRIVNAFPLDTLSIATSTIPETGDMLLVRDAKMLLIFSHRTLTAYDIADPKNPIKKWTYEYSDNTSLVTARLHQGKVFLVTQTWLDTARPCPVMPILRGVQTITVPCTDIWIPGRIEPVNATYTIATLDPTTGSVAKTVTFAGDTNNTVVSMFNGAIYLSYRSQSAIATVYMDFYETQLTDVLSADTVARIRTIRGYDISDGSKLHEIQRAVNAAMATRAGDDALKVQNDMHNRLQRYLESRIRETDTTTIARIPTDTLTVAATGAIPGHLLNHFSLDEYGGHLRVAVTVGDTWNTPGGTRNDVYVLRPDLTIAGSVTDLGLTERIYSARFIGNRGYLVTFRQIDPFFVLDLSVPSAPKRVGELKIPGYSAYLEPIDEHTILGVGREDAQVKLSLFDVSNPANPVEKAKYTLTESWTEVENNHRAFLKDARHSVFFIPASNGGYVFSYAGGTLSLKMAVKGFVVKRAAYIDNYLYVIGDNAITVIDETTWTEVKKLELGQ